MTGQHNVLKFNQKYALAKWLNKHIDWCVSKGLTATEVARKAGSELGHPITSANLKNLWVTQMKKAWPFKREATMGNGVLTKAGLRAENRAIARALADLYGRLGSIQDCDPEVRRIAGIEDITEGSLLP